MRSAARRVPPSSAISRLDLLQPPGDFGVVDQREGGLAQGLGGRLLRGEVAGDTERLEHVRVAELVHGLRYGDHRRGRWPVPPGCRPRPRG